MSNRLNRVWRDDDPVALLLAGGDGKRLLDLTTEITGAPIPKQYCRLWHGSSLLQTAILRASLLTSLDRISVIVNQDHLRFAGEQLSELLPSNILVQPSNQDTGPGIVFALLRLERNYPNAIVAVFPTDHYISNDSAFVAHVLQARDTILEMPDKVALLGIVPDRPETGYGYVVPASPLQSLAKNYRVQAFVEKPDIGSARRIMAQGALWNTFVMVFRLSRALELVCEVMPQYFDKLSQLQKYPEKAPDLYRSLQPWNFSRQILEAIPEHLILHEVADVHWSDWGTRESIERTYESLHVVPFWKMQHPWIGEHWAAGGGH
jgi:mannose-1-phosphate guanylyltransferase